MTTLSPIKSIRKHCIECSGGKLKEVKNCIITECPLYPFRMGTNPARTGKGNTLGNRKIGILRLDFLNNSSKPIHAIGSAEDNKKILI